MAENGVISPENDHFPAPEDRVRSSRAMSRSGRTSPAHSAHGSYFRSTILNSSQEKRAKKVRFYRNGDRFFKGMLYAVSPERFRTFESLLAELTNSPLCDNTVLPNGVRCIFSIDGSRKITSLDQLEEEESYVCASTGVFRKMDYPKSNTPIWKVNASRGGDGKEGWIPFTLAKDSEDLMDTERKYIRPKLVTIVRNGIKPRKAVRVLLNKKTAHCFDQVLSDITDAIKLDSGAVKKVFTLDGKPVTCLADFFGEETVFIAYGPERYALDDFDLDDNEIRVVSPYRSVRSKDRVTLKSPKPPRRLVSSSKGLNDGLHIPRRRSGTPPGSPISGRKAKNKSGGRTKLTNGHTENDSAPMLLLKKYHIGCVIGEGNFAVVKECTDKKKRKEFALKIISKNKCHGKEQMIENEVSILRRVKHSNIVQLIEEFDTELEFYLVMELVRGGDLFDAISTATKYTERDASGMLYNLGSAVKYLHSLNIAHRDIKPENLLVCEHEDGSKSLKLGDFGLAIEVTDELYTVCGTPTYVAPEILAETGYGLKVDIWATGVIAYILLCGFPPFVSPNNNQEELFDKIMAGKYEYTSPFWDDISHSAKELITLMLEVDPEKRYSAEQVLAHAWVADDTAKDEDMHVTVTSKLGVHFDRKAKQRRQEPGIALITSTALDKGSRYFQGRKSGNSLQEYDQHSTADEVF